MTMPSKAGTFSVRLPDETREQVDHLAHLTKRSRSFIINEAVASYIHAQGDYAREIAEAVKSAESGIGHSKEQVFAWLDSWADGQKKPTPKPDIYPVK